MQLRIHLVSHQSPSNREERPGDVIIGETLTTMLEKWTKLVDTDEERNLGKLVSGVELHGIDIPAFWRIKEHSGVHSALIVVEIAFACIFAPQK